MIGNVFNVDFISYSVFDIHIIILLGICFLVDGMDDLHVILIEPIVPWDIHDLAFQFFWSVLGIRCRK